MEWARRNLGLNNLYSATHEFVKSDVMEWLRGEGGGSERGIGGMGGMAGRNPLGTSGVPGGVQGLFDLAVVDPPTFSNSKGTEEDWEVSSAHVEMFGLLGPLMASGGVVYFSTNFRKFKMDEAGVAGAGFTVREISRRTVPPEYRNKRIHRCWRMVMVGRDAAVAQMSPRADVEVNAPDELDGD